MELSELQRVSTRQREVERGNLRIVSGAREEVASAYSSVQLRQRANGLRVTREGTESLSTLPELDKVVGRACVKVVSFRRGVEKRATDQ